MTAYIRTSCQGASKNLYTEIIFVIIGFLASILTKSGLKRMILFPQAHIMIQASVVLSVYLKNGPSLRGKFWPTLMSGILHHGRMIR